MNILGVIPANAGIHISVILLKRIFWTPAFAGVTMCVFWTPASVLASPAIVPCIALPSASMQSCAALPPPSMESFAGVTTTFYMASIVSVTEEGVKSPRTKDQTHSAPGAASPSPVVLEARQALRQAQDHEKNNTFHAARLLYQRAVKLAGSRDPKTRAAARRGLDYKLPLREARWRLAKGELGGAFRLLKQAARVNQGYPERLEKITALIDRVKSIHAKRQSQEASELLLPRIKQRLADYRNRMGHYPLTVKALNEVLPADQAPLKFHDIIGYKATSQAYHMLLRSKTDPKHILSLDVTGLIQ